MKYAIDIVIAIKQHVYRAFFRLHNLNSMTCLQAIMSVI